KALFSGLFLMTRRSVLRGAPLAAILFCSILVWPHAASAQTVGDVMCNVWFNLGPYGNLINAIVWVFGGILIGMGLLHLKNYHDSPHNHPVYQGLLKIAAGAALMTLPFFTSAVINSIFFTPGVAGATACVAGNTTAVVLPDLVTMLVNFMNNISYPL